LRGDVRRSEGGHPRGDREGVPVHEPAFVAARGRDEQGRLGDDVGLRGGGADDAAAQRRASGGPEVRHEAHHHRPPDEGRPSGRALDEGRQGRRERVLAGRAAARRGRAIKSSKLQAPSSKFQVQTSTFGACWDLDLGAWILDLDQNPPPTPYRNSPRGVGVGTATMLAPRTPSVSPVIPAGACCTASKFTTADSYSSVVCSRLTCACS